jgi:hypothetical protein
VAGEQSGCGELDGREERQISRTRGDDSIHAVLRTSGPGRSLDAWLPWMFDAGVECRFQPERVGRNLCGGAASNRMC